MNITINTLKKLINEEFQRRGLQEAKEEDKKEFPDIDDKEKYSIAQALDVLEGATEHLEDPDEAKWYLTKTGEMFGLDPEEIE